MYGKYEKSHDQLEIPERSGKFLTEGMGTIESSSKAYDSTGKIKSMYKRIPVDDERKWILIEYDAAGKPIKQHMPFATVKDLTKSEKNYKPEKIEEMRKKILAIESIQPPFNKQYDKRLLDELGGEQFEQILKR